MNWKNNWTASTAPNKSDVPLCAVNATRDAANNPPKISDRQMARMWFGRLVTLSMDIMDAFRAAGELTTRPPQRLACASSLKRIHEHCVISWFSDANEMCAFVACRGVSLAGNVARVAS